MSLQKIVLGGGCFWCLEASFQLIDGIVQVLPGYAGGTTENPTYQDLHTSDTNHAEVVEVTFDTEKIECKDVLDIFWVLHDPTTLNRQGNDQGTEYRSIILYGDDEQKTVALASKAEAQKVWNDPIVTEIQPLKQFYEAEEEHHNYYLKHPESAYCQVIINPKLEKLRAKFASRLRHA